MTQNTTLKADNFVTSSGMCYLSLQTLYEKLSSVAVDGLISKADFMDSYVVNMNKDHLSDSTYHKNRSLFLSLFKNFDRSDSDYADALELITGLAVLSDGNKSKTLAFSFDIMADRDRLNRRDLWRFFRSILCTLMTIAEPSNTKLSNELLNSCAMWSVNNLLGWLNKSHITFQDLADWYTHRGHNDASFIELMDLRKWLPLSEGLQQKQSKPSGASDIDTNFFTVNLTNGRKMTFSDEQIDFVFDLAESSTLISTDCFILFKRLAEYSFEGSVTLEAFELFLANCFNFTSDDAEVVTTLLQMNELLDEGSTGEVDIRHLAAALSFFCAGSKSHKLSLGFQMWDLSNHGSIAISDLRDMLQTFLTVLYMVSQLGIDLDCSTARVRSELRSVCDSICRRIQSDVKRDAISFETFGNWYNATGFAIVPWLELINVAKWDPATNPSSATHPASSALSRGADDGEDDSEDDNEDDSEDDNEDGNDDDDEYDDGKDDDAFSIVMYTSHSKAPTFNCTVSRETARKYCALFAGLGLDASSTSAFVEEGSDGLLSEQNYHALVGAMYLPRFRQSESSYVDSLFSTLFFAFDRAGEETYVDSVEIAIGMMVFLQGSKSSKLAAAFDYLDTNKDGLLSRRDVWRMLRSFMCTLVVIDSFISNKTLDDSHFLIDAACVWLVDSLFSSLDEEHASICSFDDIAEWYQSTGCRLASWLELLDKKKWEMLLLL